MMRKLCLATLGLAAWAGLLLPPAQGVETETWRQSSYEEFSQGKRERVALRSDGLLTLSPALSELLDSSADAIWALAADSKGNVYTAASAAEGNKLRVFRIAPDGKSEAVAEVDGLACFALTVDRQDRVYIGVSPEARIFRVTGKTAELFTELPAAYVWAMAFDSKQNLFAATGDKGVIYRVDSNGKAAVFLETEETHVRSLRIDGKDQIFAGTAPSGLVMRISEAGEPFVIYQAAREEITSLALNRAGDLFLAAAGAKRSSGIRIAPAPAPAATVVPAPAPNAPAPAAQSGNPPQAPRPAPAAARPAVAAGSDVVRIGSDGFPETVWENDRDIVYALAADAEDRIVLGTGNGGSLVRLESNRLHTSLLEARAEQITALLPRSDGAVVFATANIGKVHQAGPALAESGSFESNVFDSEFFARWGRVAVEGKEGGDSLTVQVRSGNVSRPQKNWSGWSSAAKLGRENVIIVPPARYAQWRAELKRSTVAPELRAVELAYRSKNLPPRVTITEATPPNHSFPPRMLAITPTDKLTLQPLSGRSRPRSTPLPTVGGGSLSMNYLKGHVGVRWLAEDANGDDLRYALEIRAVGSSNWLQLVKDIKETQYSWDSNSWPDGRYEVRITASDRESNVPEQALEGSAVTDPFVIDNSKPEISALNAKWTGSGVELGWTATDERSPVRRAHYSLNGQDWIPVEPENGLSDATTLRYSLRLAEAAAGSAALSVGSVVAVRVADEFDNETVASVAIPAR